METQNHGMGLAAYHSPGAASRLSDIGGAWIAKSDPGPAARDDVPGRRGLIRAVLSLFGCVPRRDLCAARAAAESRLAQLEASERERRDLLSEVIRYARTIDRLQTELESMPRRDPASGRMVSRRA